MIDIEKFICSLLADHPEGVAVRGDIYRALKEQGLEYKGGKIVPIEDNTELKESEDDKIRKALIDYFDDANKADENPLQSYSIPIDKAIAWLEKQGEQKTTDKVEPRFKVGDWIINTESGYIRQILKINNGCYETDYGVLPIKDYESIFRLWTIQNAKEGEVLALFYASQNYILIYKGLYEKSFKTIMSVFCFYCVEEDEYYDETDSFHVMNRGEIITPATKEQRDLLFQKMKDEGYEWDAEKKELIKIEQV